MTTKPTTKITVSAEIAAPVNQVWTAYNSPKHIVQWNCASPDWHSPSAKNELEPGGSFSYRMEAKDGSMGFDFEGVFQKVQPNEFLSYVMGDGRAAEVVFEDKGKSTLVTVTFDAEQMNSEELQRDGWQSILDNFKKYVEGFQHDSMHFEVEINAPVSKVFALMIEDAAYRDWTAAFNPGSYFKGDWSKGSKILFLGPDPQSGKEGGMVAKIADNVKNKYISIEHYGLVGDGKEITSGPEVEAFAGATENYSFVDLGGKTLLKVDMESGGEYKEMFEKMWPKALQRLKEICEA
ncbi:SRPBCC domain-containing protein [Algoriphagus sp. H41]|uniref:SRPBCC domain-containing protein n=1 Tax=Algoriphagus oliviformis TaxID=2811231 RepID=A0ABS3C929_9BACT|nr:SRPBCC family protein [Algoriphagus oliviformis]MBN7813622.1 SRPBCC domain-containing protein [Algoriphagus oliviformis]